MLLTPLERSRVLTPTDAEWHAVLLIRREKQPPLFQLLSGQKSSGQPKLAEIHFIKTVTPQIMLSQKWNYIIDRAIRPLTFRVRFTIHSLSVFYSFVPLADNVSIILTQRKWSYFELSSQKYISH